MQWPQPSRAQDEFAMLESGLYQHTSLCKNEGWKGGSTGFFYLRGWCAGCGALD